MTFAETLKRERLRLGILQPQVAALLGIKPRTYWDWEAGRVEPMGITMEGATRRLNSLPMDKQVLRRALRKAEKSGKKKIALSAK